MEVRFMARDFSTGCSIRLRGLSCGLLEMRRGARHDASAMEFRERIRGCLLGLAVGDALGHPTEFVPSLGAIRARWGARGVEGFVAAGRHPPGTFTDDTQMALCVARALCRAGRRDLDTLMAVMSEEFVAWVLSPANDRAPGGTCLTGCYALQRGVPWREAGVKGSKGCGAAMRAAPVGLYFADDRGALVRVSAAQSALTHAHPTGVASGVAAAAAVAWAARGGPAAGLVGAVRDAVRCIDDALLVDVGCDPRLVAALGVREMLEALDRTEAVQHDEHEDVCELLGGAWVGEEAVACALWCVLKAGDDFARAVLRGANSGGDSDSIACIAGSIAGAALGPGAIPAVWRSEVESPWLLEGLAVALHRAVTSGDHAPDAALDPFGALAQPTLYAVAPEPLP